MKNVDKKIPKGSLNETPRSKKSKQPALMSLAATMLISEYDETKSSISSPSSLYLALETLARGAEGETLAEIETILGGSEERNKTRSMLFKKNPSTAPDNYLLNFATSLWANKNTASLLPSYSKAIADINGKAAELEFGTPESDKTVSSWLSDNTGGKFTSAPSLNSSTVFAIVSALHYRDNWIDPLDIDQIEIPFHAASGKQPIMMMIGSGSNGNLLENDDAIAASWPMESGATAIFTMPKEAIDITGFVKSGMAWETITRCRKGEESFKPSGGIKLILPEIDLKSEDFDLAGKLRAMGLHKIFQPNAELHEITEAEASVTQIIQESMLKLDANGAEGAAYTAIVSVTGCNVFDPVSEPVTVIFDRPFAFAVFSHSDVPLFVGTYLGE